MKGRTHQTLNYPFCILCPIIYFFQKLVEVVNALGWEEYGSQIRIEEVTHFWENGFLLMGQLNTRKWMPKPLSTHSFFSLTQLEFLCISLHIFDNFLNFIHGWEVIFVMLSGWDFSFTFFYLFLIFPCPEIHFFTAE